MYTHRYDRNRPLISDQLQASLTQLTVVIVGVGGLGGHVAETCARLGIGRLILIDGDVFDETNLNRQRFATENNIGESKVAATKSGIASINSDTVVVAHHVWLKDLSDRFYVSDAQFIVDCLDDIETRILLNDFSKALNIPLIHGAIDGWEGQYGFFLPGTDPMHVLYPYGKQTKVAETANLPTLPPIVAAMQVNLLIAYLLDDSHFEANVLYRFNVQTKEMTRIPLG